MMAGESQLLKVIILDQQAAERRRLVGLLAQTPFHFSIFEASGEREALETLAKEEVSLFLLGAGYPLMTQQQILMKTAKSPLGRDCAFVVVTEDHDRQTVLSLVRAGASGVLLAPLSLEPLNQAIDTALNLVREANSRDSDQINSLPWILEGIARRLEAIALELHDGEAGSAPATTKRMQEALLLAFSGKTDLQDRGTELAAKRLARGQAVH